MSNKPLAPDLQKSHDFAEVLGHIQQTRHQVFAQVNTALIDLYWRVGETLNHKIAQSGWGKGVVTELARYIALTDPSIKGFSDKNLWRMKQFYETYQGDEKLSTLVRQLPWSHNLAIFSRCKTTQERVFYLQQAVAEKYSFRQLDRQISASLFERQQLSPPKLSTALRVLHPNIGDTFKDQYVLEFLGLSESHSETDLMAPLDLAWIARSQGELALMDDLLPLLGKRASGRDISGLSAYE
jgi:predicted nuclease of restriction endonuclease-like (RecB) superfamily